MATKGQVLQLHSQNPNWSAVQIAERIGCLPEYVRATLSRHRRRGESRIVRKKIYASLWSEADLETLVEKREVEGKKWHVIAAEMNRPLGSCHDRYTKIIRAREPVPSIVPEVSPRRVPLHEELGIQTFVHHQAILCDPNGVRGTKSEQSNAHWYRMQITLPKVFV